MTEETRPLGSESTAVVGSPPVLPAAPPRQRLAPGSRLERYVVLELLGEGGMGVVYAAYDSELHRKVALKLLHPETSGADGGARSSSGQQRLLREAQALAQLAHPNVVGVHDVGTYLDSVFIAMEFIEGQNLRAWMKERPREWKEVLAVFMEAGKGLAAAHAKGLVHRDFKPDNVLVSTEGRVYVLDFGLARAQDSVHVEPSSTLGLEPGNASVPTTGELLATPLTQAGAVIGTVPYMASELLEGAPADGRSDLFAFAVSLYEVLYGERPFPRHGEKVLRPPPEGRKVPAWLRRVVLKGLSTSPQARQASMLELLEELGRDPAPRRRQWLLALGLVLATGVAGVGLQQAAQARSQLCQADAEKLRGIWDVSVESSLRQAFLATGHEDAARTWQRSAKALSAYAEKLVAARRQACIETRVKGTQTDEVFTLKMECLNRRLTDLQALTGVFAKPQGEVVSKAQDAVENLPPLEACDNLQALRAPLRPPEEPRKRAQVDAMWKELSRSKALYDIGEYKQSQQLAEKVLETALSLGYRPLEAEALADLALARYRLDQGASVATWERAVSAAIAGKHTAVLVRASTGLIWNSYGSGRYSEGPLWAQVAHAALEAHGGDLDLEADLLSARGALASALQPSSRESLELTERALELKKKVYGEDSPKLELKYYNLGNAFKEAREYPAARLNLEKALELMLKNRGRDFASLNYPLAMLGRLETAERGPSKEAEEYLHEALRIANAKVGPEHSDSLETVEKLGELYLARGEYGQVVDSVQPALRLLLDHPDSVYVPVYQELLAKAFRGLNRLPEALALNRKDCALWAKLAEPGTPEVIRCHLSLGETLLRLGRRAESLAELKRVLAATEKRATSPFLYADVQASLGDWYREGGQQKEALVHYERALGSIEPRLGRDHLDVGRLLLSIGVAHLALKQPGDARAALERAVVILPKAHLAPELQGEARFALARALVSEGGEAARARGRALAAQAAQDFQRSEAGDKSSREAQVRRWVDGLRRALAVHTGVP